MSTVISRDGTPIAYERRGSGPAVILVGGGLDDGAENAPLAAELAADFTTYNYARRGRGASGDTQPYAVEREIEDIAALIGEAGGRAHAYGVSSGGMFALEAVLAGLAIDRVAVYDVPYDTSGEAPQRFDEYREQLDAALSEGRRGDAVELFMRLAGSPDEQIAAARASPTGPVWRPSRTRSPTTPRSTVSRRSIGSRRSSCRPWSRREERAASSWRPRTPWRRVSRTPIAPR
jgi:hypothetical protein